MNETTDRQTRINDARSVLDFLEANPGLPLPEVKLASFPSDTPQNLAAVIRAIDDRCEFEARPGSIIFRLTKKIGDASISFIFGKQLIGIDGESMALTESPDLDALKGVEGVGETAAKCSHGLAKQLFCSQCFDEAAGITEFTRTEGRKAKRIQFLKEGIERVQVAVESENAACYFFRSDPLNVESDLSWVRKCDAEVIEYEDINAEGF